MKVELASRLGKQRLFVAAGGIYRCFDSQHSALVVVAYTSPRETDLQHFALVFVAYHSIGNTLL